MKNQKNIPTKIEEILASLDDINEVKISSSFKQNVFSKIEQNKKEKPVLIWFTPQLQLAAMLVILFVNVSAIVYTFSTQEQTPEIETFAQEYNFETSTTFTLN
ncbi:MAG: hypothetical protein ACPGTO_01750 [Polaribacter sp.]